MLKQLEKHPLFAGISSSDIEKFLTCFASYTKTYKKGEYIIREGDTINFIGIPLTGRVFMEKEDYSGNLYLFTELQLNHLIGDVFICPQQQKSTVNYKAVTECTMAFLKYENILHLCKCNCHCHQLLHENLVNLIALKNRMLMDKIEILSKKSIRDRIITYLSLLSRYQNTETIISPLNHKEMAGFLCVNRSSMVRELHHMKEDHVIDFNRNKYMLTQRSLCI